VSCGYSKQILALYIEDDLPTPEALSRVESHVSSCLECREYCGQLRQSQSVIKARFGWTHREAITQETLRSVRSHVMSQIDEVRRSARWTLKLERFFILGLRRRPYALTCAGVLAIVSVSLLGQMRPAQQPNAGPAIFAAGNTLLRPSGYREWIFAGSSLGLSYGRRQVSETYHNVYIDPAAYREYVRSGKFPEGTVMVLEIFSAENKNEPDLHGSYEKNLVALEASVKDSSRFEGGWGFYDFTGETGSLKPEADALPQTAGCLACHRERAATDHVFTQFYPVLRRS
jgi:hypothetical protein